MKKIIGLILIIISISCNTIKAKENTLKESDSNVELGALGTANQQWDLQITLPLPLILQLKGK